MRIMEELSWLAFFLPREGLQVLARRLPLAKLRDALPAPVGEKLRLGLYPARVTDARAVTVARAHPPWGDPATLDATRPVRYEAPPRASILMVTYGNLALTRLCLASIQRAAGPTPFEVIVVDNASPDGSAAVLQREAERGLLPMEVIANAENRGFAAANNQAAARARGELLVFLNNDTVVTPGWLEGLCAHLAREPRIGLVGPVTNSCGNEAEVPVDYDTIEGMFRFAEAYTRAHAGEVVDLPMLALFCAAMPRALYQALGGLDERYRVGLFEDDDLAMAVRTRGRRTTLARDVFVHHYGSAAFSSLPPARYLRLWWENRRRFERKWGTKWVKR